MTRSDELLRKKAMLLLRREREVFELRHERGRTELWLKVFHKLSRNFHATPSSLLEQWVGAMVDELTFQVAAVHSYDAQTQTLRLISGLGPRELASHVQTDARAYDHLHENPSGFYDGRSPEELRLYARALELGMFYWLLVPNRRQILVFSAGFIMGTEFYRGVNQQDLLHFVQLGNHLAALLENARLIAELDREKSELSASNQKLDTNLSELRETRDKLVESSKLLAEVSRRAGMADVATGILHNVGNALNSVNVSVETLAEKLNGLELSGIGKLASLLAREGHDLATFLATDERAKKLPAYVEELGAHIVRERAGMLWEVSSLRKHVEHMKAIVGKQQSYAMMFDVAQSCSVAGLVEDAITLSEHGLGDLGIEITRDFEAVPDIVTDRHKVLQILVNLISNAKHALSDPALAVRRLVLKVSAGSASDRAVILVTDTGVGIPPENLDRLFRYGYTTRPGGHGIGLHASAIAARDLGGRLSAESAGPGKGASFLLELPRRPSGSTAPAARV